jgi:3-isopropylmalate/(R)-2-methylmalate dehydratase large subunit
MVTGETWFRVPESIRFVFNGRLQPWVSGKDLILYTIGAIGVDGALYKAMEFTGEVMGDLSMADRFTITNMAIEAGAKSGIIVPDGVTKDYVKERIDTADRIVYYSSDEDARYTETIEYRVDEIEPQVAFPHSPENTRAISAVGSVPINQAVIGSCTNGRLEDLKIAAHVLKGKKTAPSVRLIIIPATPWIYQQAVRLGLFEIFMNAQAIISPPTCGPCLGGHMGILAQGERAITTTNRNFVGRMGHTESEVYLANPAVAAASAVLGRIGSPQEIGAEEYS